ncbi:hypothetical protein D3C72_2133680 [compost metagenome]
MFDIAAFYKAKLGRVDVSTDPMREVRMRLGEYLPVVSPEAGIGQSNRAHRRVARMEDADYGWLAF